MKSPQVTPEKRVKEAEKMSSRRNVEVHHHQAPLASALGNLFVCSIADYFSIPSLAHSLKDRNQ